MSNNYIICDSDSASSKPVKDSKKEAITIGISSKRIADGLRSGAWRTETKHFTYNTFFDGII